MKRFCFRFVVAVAIAVSLFSAAVHGAETATGTTDIKANVAGAILVEQWPAAEFTITDGVVPGTSTVSGPFTFVVKCNSTWGITVKSDEPTGSLREADSATGEYVVSPLVMKHPLQWGVSTSGPWTNVTNTPATVYSAQPKTGDTGASVDIYFRTTASFDDDCLPTGKEYMIRLFYTAGVSY